MVSKPMDIPVSNPPLVMLPEPLLLAQVPPGVMLLNVIVVPAHMVAGPEIAATPDATTVSVRVVNTVPQLLVTV